MLLLSSPLSVAPRLVGLLAQCAYKYVKFGYLERNSGTTDIGDNTTSTKYANSIMVNGGACCVATAARPAPHPAARQPLAR